MRLTIASLLLLFTAWAFAAGGYKVVHPDGTVEFTDQPRQGAQEFEIPQAQTYAPPPLPAMEEPSSSQEKPKPQPARSYRELSIVSPADDKSAVANDGQLPVSVSIQPALGQGDRIVLSIDGQMAGEGSGPFVVQGVENGTHTLEAKVVDTAGRVLLRSQPSKVHALKHTTR